MSSPFKTDLDQLQLTTQQVGTTVQDMLTYAKELRASVDFVNRWQGDAANAFRATMGVNTAELDKLVKALENMAGNLGMTTQGVMAQESDAAKQINATQNAGALRAPLNQV